MTCKGLCSESDMGLDFKFNCQSIEIVKMSYFDKFQVKIIVTMTLNIDTGCLKSMLWNKEFSGTSKN